MPIEQDMGSYYARRAAEYERIYHKPERQADLRALEAEMPAFFAGHWWSHVKLQDLPRWLDGLHQRLRPGAVVVFLDNLYVPGSSTPIARRDDAGNSYQERRLDDGSVHEVLKNFPTREQALAVLGPRAQGADWASFGHYWRLRYRLT